jgi:hypothetical protein
VLVQIQIADEQHKPFIPHKIFINVGFRFDIFRILLEFHFVAGRLIVLNKFPENKEQRVVARTDQGVQGAWHLFDACHFDLC